MSTNSTLAASLHSTSTSLDTESRGPTLEPNPDPLP